MASTEAFLQQITSAGLPRKGPAAWWEEFTYQNIDMRAMKLNLGALVPFVTLEGQGVLDTKTLPRLIAFSREHTGGATVVVTAQTASSELMEACDLEQHSIAIIDAPVLESMARARDVESRYRVLGSAMARTVKYAALSPYSFGSPASANRFFGRDETIRRILTGKNIKSSTIVGNRRIGKTSLMHEVRERLKNVYVHGKTLHFAELYGSKCKSTWDAVYLIFDQIGLQVPKGITKFGAIAPRYVHRMPQLLHEFARTRQTQVVLFIDEYDELLERDATQGYQFTHLLREAAMAELNCSVIIAGFRYLMQMRTRQESPLYNFTQEIQLTPLIREECIKMINLPLSRLGIDIADTNLPGIIYRETRGQPELIQMYCQAVIQAFEARRKAPSEAELLRVVNQNPEFNRTITHAFLSNANEFEQVICLELMKKAVYSQQGVAHFEFRFQDVEQVLESCGFSLSNSQLAIVINNLAVGSFIERVKGGGAPGLYRFATPQLVRFCDGVGLDSLLAKAKTRMGSGPPIVEAISRDPAVGSTVAGKA